MGIIRSFVDDWAEAEAAGLMDEAAAALAKANLRVRFIAGYATREFLKPLAASSTVAPFFAPLLVKNDFFGGNVDVTGLLCGCDMVAAIQKDRAAVSEEDTVLYVVPRVVFNDDGVTLDDMTLEDMENETEALMSVVSCNASDFLREIIELAGRQAPRP